MSRQKRTPSLGDAPVTRARGGARDRLRDAGSKELAQLAKKVGNDQVGALLGSARAKQDALLAFVQERLAAIQAAQRAEQKELADRRDWWVQVSRGKPSFTLPDPTRWHASALQYKRAAEALCAGDIGRGAHLLDAAVRAERAAFESMPVQVELPSSVSAARAGPEERPFVDEGEAAPPTQAPGLFKVADTILRVTQSSELLPVTRNNPTHNWWEAPEEEAADEKKKKPTDGKATASPAVETPRPERAEKESAVDKDAKSNRTPERAPERAAPERAVPEMEPPKPRRGKKP